jgi:hypothetical protein
VTAPPPLSLSLPQAPALSAARALFRFLRANLGVGFGRFWSSLRRWRISLQRVSLTGSNCFRIVVDFRHYNKMRAWGYLGMHIWRGNEIVFRVTGSSIRWNAFNGEPAHWWWTQSMEGFCGYSKDQRVAKILDANFVTLSDCYVWKKASSFLWTMLLRIEVHT